MKKALIAGQHIFLGVGDVPYQNQGHVSAKLRNQNGFSRRIERGLSDVFGTELHDLPETREEVLTAGKAVTKDPVLLLGRTRRKPRFKLEPLPISKSFISPLMGLLTRSFQNVQAWCWVWTPVLMMMVSYRSGKSSGSISMLT